MDSCSVTMTPPCRPLFSPLPSQNQYTLETKRTNSMITDRYIPKKLNFDAFAFRNMGNVTEPSPSQDKPNLNQTLKRRQSLEKYQNVLKRNLSSENNKGKILSYFDHRNKKEGFVFGQDSDVEEPELVRSIPKKPYKLLEAPKLKDDFYYNILDWSKTDLIATSLNNTVYMWTGRQNDAERITDGRVSCVKFSQEGLAVGDQLGQTKIYDLVTKKIVTKMANHFGRIGTIDFNNNLMVTGSKDERIIVNDLRINKIVAKFDGHKQEVCGVKWSFDGNHFASGGNDNKVFIWSTRMNKEIGKINDHSAAVKGLAWSPHKHSILATGGGTSDKTIKVWNTSDMSLVHNIDSGSQVCNMIFSQNTNELVTTHGYSLNTICVWRQKDMKKIATLHGHSYRVLYLAMSPNGENIVSGSGDETLRFWKVFPSKSNQVQMGSNLDLNECTIR